MKLSAALLATASVAGATGMAELPIPVSEDIVSILLQSTLVLQTRPSLWFLCHAAETAGSPSSALAGGASS